MATTTLYPRSLRGVLERDSTVYPILVVTGARQVGKSTLCRDFADAHGLNYRTLDDPDVLKQAQDDPNGLLDDLGDNGAFLDEAQRAPNLFLALKAVVDREQRPGRYLLTGSNQPKVKASVGDSLLGRAVYRTLQPLTLSELRFDETHSGWDFLFSDNESQLIAELERRAEASGAPNWKEVAMTGGFPRAVASPPDQRAEVLDTYVRVFASRDIREILGVDSPERFESFLRLVAARTAQELNINGISNDLGAPASTIRRWVDALQRSYLVNLMQPYSRNAGQRVIKAPKLFAVDSAFALAAARETDPTGFHLETVIATDLCVWRDGAAGRAVYHWRLQGGQEVDFVAELSGQLVPIEIKAGPAVGPSESRHLRTFRERHQNSPRGLLLSCDPQIRILQPGVIAAPWWAVL